MTLVQEINTYSVPQKKIALWWLGQSGFILKSPGGVRIAIDPYLSNSCQPLGQRAGLDYDRQVPVFIEPEALQVDVMVLTHSHQDHCDPETITRHRSSGFKGPYVASGETMTKLEGLGVQPSEIALTWPNKELRFGDVTLKATFAIPPAGDDVTHLGYLVFVDSGPTIYVTGDTDYHDVLTYVRDYKPNIMITVVNGLSRNLGPDAAAHLAREIAPDIVIPCHHDMFRDNTLDPRMFRAALMSKGIGDKFVELKQSERFTYPR